MPAASRVLALGSLAAALAFCGPARPEAPERKDAPKPRPFQEILKKYDADGDGRLGPQEREALRRDAGQGRLEVPPEVRERILGQGRANPAAAAPRATEGVIIERDVQYGRAGEKPLLLDLVRPRQPAKGPLPVICFIHGGGWRGGDKAAGVGRVAPLAATGNYFGVSVEYRLSGVAKWPAQIHDCKAAIRWIRANAKKYDIDPQRIGVWGSSAGGHLVSMLGTSGDVKELEGEGGSPDQSSRVACVVDFCGPSNFLAPKKFEGGREPGAVTLLLGGRVEENRELARQASPITYVSKDDPPFLIVHGTADGTVPFQQAQMLYDALKNAGCDATFIKMEGGGHGVGGSEITERVNAFLDRHLRGRDVEVSDEPIAAAQRPQRKG